MSVRGHYVALMVGARYYTATVPSWLTDHSLAPHYGGVALCIRAGRRPLRARNSASLRSGLRFLSLRGFFIGYAKRPRAIFLSPRRGTMPPPALRRGSLSYALNLPSVCVHTRVFLPFPVLSSLPLDSIPPTVLSVVPYRAS